MTNDHNSLSDHSTERTSGHTSKQKITSPLHAVVGLSSHRSLLGKADKTRVRVSEREALGVVRHKRGAKTVQGQRHRLMGSKEAGHWWWWVRSSGRLM